MESAVPKGGDHRVHTSFRTSSINAAQRRRVPLPVGRASRNDVFRFVRQGLKLARISWEAHRYAVCPATQQQTNERRGIMGSSDVYRSFCALRCSLGNLGKAKGARGL
jgi:hypothetical protein